MNSNLRFDEHDIYFPLLIKMVLNRLGNIEQLKPKKIQDAFFPLLDKVILSDTNSK